MAGWTGNQAVQGSRSISHQHHQSIPPSHQLFALFLACSEESSTYHALTFSLAGAIKLFGDCFRMAVMSRREGRLRQGMGMGMGSRDGRPHLTEIPEQAREKI